MSATTASKVEVPDIGDFDEVPVIEILVAVGDSVAAEDPLVTLESDKATMDVPAPFAGTVRELSVAIGDRVAQGMVLMTIEPSDGDSGSAAADDEAPAAESQADAAPADAAPADAAPAEAAEATPPESESPAPSGKTSAQSPAVPGNGGDPVYASPSVRRLARELGVGLSGVTGSGRKGRITKEDVQARADGGGPASAGAGSAGGPSGGGAVAGLDLAPWPQVDFAKFGGIERVARTRIQRISGPNLARNWVMIPHVTHNDETDITELEAWRKQLNTEYEQPDDAGAARSGEAGSRAGGRPAQVKVTMVSFLVMACVATLKAFETFNASLDGEDLILKRYYNIGFAADTPGGLVVPVIRDADRKGLIEVARDLTTLSGKAREGRLSLAEMSGSTFTISSLGGIGGTSFTPIINAPEVAILGVTRSAMKPVWDAAAGTFVPRLMLPLSLSYDHRVIDGALAARFTSHLARVLTDMRRLLL
jgi:pyruvate dehydrogenase E2 component (dihydrolipoamide acetyltransferase)